MKFKYIGKAGVRIVKQYRWEARNGFIQDVEEPELIENLLTYPTGEFMQLDDDGVDVKPDAEPLLPAAKTKPRKGKRSKKL